MKQLAALARFLHFTNVLIGIACVALCFQTALFLDWIFIPHWFYLFMFSNTFLQYGLHDLYSKKGSTNAKPKLSFWLRNRPYFIGCITISGFVSGYLCFRLHSNQLIWLVILSFITIAYSFPVLPFKNLRRFKQNGILKLLILALVWTITTTVIPATFIPYGFDSKFWWLATVRFFYMLAICIPFDIRDDILDVRTSNVTMVSLFGEEGCYRLSYACLGIAAFGIVPGLLIGVNILLLLPLLLSLVFTGWMISYSNRHMFSPTSYIMLDASMILQTLLICIPILIA